MRVSMLVGVLLLIICAKNIPAAPNVSSTGGTLKGLRPECEVESIYVMYVDESLLVSWGAVDASCSEGPTYKVTYIVNDNEEGTVDSMMPNMPMAQIQFGALGCKRVSIVVKVYEGGDIIGQSSTRVFDRNLDDIVGLSTEQTVEGLLIAWEPLDLEESCDVTYNIRYRVEGGSNEIKSTKEPFYLLTLDSVTSCTVYEIEIAASSNNLFSLPVSVTYEVGIAGVRDLRLQNHEGKVLVYFKPPLDVPEKCGDVEYRVMQEDGGCFRSDFVVSPISANGNEGVALEMSIDREPGPVQNLQVIQKSGKVQLDWETPIGGVDCNMAYFISYEGMTSSIHTTSFVAAMELEACKPKEMQITPVIIVGPDYVEGRSTDLRLTGDLGPVDNVRCSLNSGSVDCSWEKSLESDNCQKLSYEILYFDGTGKTNDRTEETSYSFQISAKLCTFWINIQPVGYVDDQSWEGETTEATIEGCG